MTQTTVEAWLKLSSPLPVDERRWLLADTLGWSRGEVWVREGQVLSQETLEVLNYRLGERVRGVPHAYVVGFRDFWGAKFFVGPGVLIPRPETELLIEWALKLDVPGHAQVADWGAGSGCIGLTLARLRPHWRVRLVEESAAAHRYLMMNLREHHSIGSVEIESSSVEESTGRDYSLIVANPPYIDPMDPEVDDSVRRFEPHEALFSGQGGLSALKSWIDLAAVRLVESGALLLEIGSRQGSAVCELIDRSQSFDRIEVIKDLSEKDRCVLARLKGGGRNG